MNALATRTRNIFSPFSTLGELDSGFNRLFEGLPSEITTGAFAPAVDLREEENNYIIEADLPGMNRDDIDISVIGNVVTLKGKRNTENWKQDDGYRSIERSSGSFKRAFRIQSGVDADKVEATYDKGVLKVVLPKPENARLRQIPVNTN